MNILRLKIPTSIGDNLAIRANLEQIKHKYDRIEIAHNKWLIEIDKNNNPEYYKFIEGWGKLLFSDSPFILVDDVNKEISYYDQIGIVNLLKLTPTKPSFKHLLPKGESLNLNKPYFVLTTKIRYLVRSLFNEIQPKLWDAINKLKEKYTLVLLGERNLEANSCVITHGTDIIYCIYEDIIKNIDKNDVIDLTIPSIGFQTSSTLEKVQQDCLIMSEAEFVIVCGIGGNFLLSIACANTIGFRADCWQDNLADQIYEQEYSDAMITKDFDKFEKKLLSYL